MRAGVVGAGVCRPPDPSLGLRRYELTFREPSAAALAAVSAFAKLTGDYRSLSPVDLKVLALTYMLEVEAAGSAAHLRTEPAQAAVAPGAAVAGWHAAEPCRYGLGCTRPDCWYAHPEPAPAAAAPPALEQPLDQQPPVAPAPASADADAPADADAAAALLAHSWGVFKGKGGPSSVVFIFLVVFFFFFLCLPRLR